MTNEPGGHDFLFDDVRMVASGTLRSTTPYWLRISQNPSTGDGGGCYGDSGGPIFLGDTTTLAAITITGDVDVPGDQHHLPAGHRLGAGVPGAVRRAALTPAGYNAATNDRGGTVASATRMGTAGLQGWRRKVGDAVADPVAERTPLGPEQVRAAVGALFFVLALMYVVRTLTAASRELSDG